MGFAPGSDAFDVGGAFEVIAVVRFIQPALLAGGFAGLTTLGVGTVTLTLDATWVGNEYVLTMQTLTCSG